MTFLACSANQFTHNIGVVLSAFINMFLSDLIMHDFMEARILDSLQEPTPRKAVLLMQTAAHIPDLDLTPHFKLKSDEKSW